MKKYKHLLQTPILHGPELDPPARNHHIIASRSVQICHNQEVKKEGAWQNDFISSCLIPSALQLDHLEKNWKGLIVIENA